MYTCSGQYIMKSHNVWFYVYRHAPPLPNRLPSHNSTNSVQQQRPPAQVMNHGFHNSISDSLLDRPPMPPPTHSSSRSNKPADRDSQTKPLSIPAGDSRVSQAYFRMNETVIVPALGTEKFLHIILNFIIALHCIVNDWFHDCFQVEI